MINILMILTGLGAMVLSLLLLWEEMQLRREKAVRLLHTTLIPLNTNLEPIPIHSTHMIIGRRKRRCDISLSALSDDRVSRVHAVLWWAGNGFRIAPVYKKRLFGKPSKPVVYVEDQPARAGVGLPVNYGDTITISSAGYRFVLENTEKGGRNNA